MGNRVKRVRTDISESEMNAAIISAWEKLFHETPTKEQVSLIMAQNSLETGHRKNMWNFNVGNITTDGKGSYNFFDDLTTDEQISPGHWQKANLKYRAYPTLEAGVLDYLLFLSKNKRYGKAWEHIVNPNPEEYSKALKSAGYYTADEKPYTKSLVGLYNKYNKNKSQDKGSEINKVEPANDTEKIIDLVDEQLKQIAASFNNKKLYEKHLTSNNILIKINSQDYESELEFARILCSALDEELSAESYTHTNGVDVEVECKIYGPSNVCFAATKQLTESVVEAFHDATKKIELLPVKPKFFMNKKSSYEAISWKNADINYRKFLFKFI